MEFWGVEEVARALKCSRWTVYALLRAVDPLPAFKPANRYLFRPDEVAAWLEGRRTNGQPQALRPARRITRRRRQMRAPKAVLEKSPLTAE